MLGSPVVEVHAQSPKSGRRWRAAAAAVVTGVVSALAAGPAQLSIAQHPRHLLRISDQIGQTSRYQVVFEMRMRAEYAGVKTTDGRAPQLVDALASGISARTAVEYEQRLAAVESDGTRTFEVRWHDYEFSGSVGEIEVPPPQGYPSSRELGSQTAQVRVTATGQPVDVTYSQPRLAGLAGQLRQMMGAMPTYLPQDAVAPGEKWVSTVELPLGPQGAGAGVMTLELEHTLRELRDGPHGPLAVIDLSGSYSQDEGTEEVTFGIPMHVEASLTGSTTFELAQGRYSDGQYQIDMFALHAADGIEIQLIGHADGNMKLLVSR